MYSMEITGSRVLTLTEAHHALWNAEQGAEAPVLRSYTGQEQRNHEEEWEGLFRQWITSVRSSQPEGAGFRNLPPRFHALLLKSLMPDQVKSNDGLFRSMELTAREFVEEAKGFDPGLSDRDLHQALRNLWVFNSIQILMGIPPSLTRASFAYSLLYPYTDNALDGVKTPDRGRFLDALTARLYDGLVLPGLPHAVRDLLDMIELDFPRSRYPAVPEGLCGIHEAQRWNLQERERHPLVPDALMRSTIGKGGASVLADGYLVLGELEPLQEEALFGYGLLLQLVDDLEDMEEDRRAGTATPFTRALDCLPIDQEVNRMFRLATHVAGTFVAAFPNASAETLALFARCSEAAVLAAATLSEDALSESYRTMLHGALPVGGPFLHRLQSRLTTFAMASRTGMPFSGMQER